MNALRSALSWTAIVLLIVCWPPLMAIVWLFDRDPAKYETGRFFRLIGVAMTKVNPAWRVTHSGTFPENPRLPYVVVSNHQSNADIPLISTLPWEMKWVGKSSLFTLPFAGWMMRMAGDIPVDRADPQSRAQVALRASRVLERRCSVMFFPEGTRSRDGRVRRFQDGAFRLAVETGKPVLPIAVDGTADALPKHGWQFGPVDCRIHVFEPVPTAGLTAADVPALRERVRGQIMAQMVAWRGVAPEALDGLADAAPASSVTPPPPSHPTLSPVEDAAKSRGGERSAG